jgi:hypothetical protein
MSEENLNKIPVWFWIVGWAALLWNLMGVFAYIMQVTMSPEMMASMPEAQREIIANTPIWATGAFALAVFGGALGSLFLLLKKKLAYPLFILSCVSVFVQMYHSLFMSNSIEVYGPGGAVMPIMVVLFGLGLIWLSRRAIDKNWIS